MPAITAVQLPIDWTAFGWPEVPDLSGTILCTGDPKWAWHPAAPAFPVHTFGAPPATTVEGFTVDHVVLLVPNLDAAVDTLGRVDLAPRLRMTIRGDRQAAFFRVGTVLEVIEAPVRAPSIYGIALTAERQLEALSLEWKALGLEIGEIGPAIQPGRRIMTVHGLDAGLAVMSPDRATL